MKLLSSHVARWAIFLSLLHRQVDAQQAPDFGNRNSIRHTELTSDTSYRGVPTVTQAASTREAPSVQTASFPAAPSYSSANVDRRDLPGMDAISASLEPLMAIQAQLQNATNLAMSYMMKMYMLAVSLEAELSQQASSSSTSSQTSTSFTTQAGQPSSGVTASSLMSSRSFTSTTTLYVNASGFVEDMTKTSKSSISTVPGMSSSPPSLSVTGSSRASAIGSLTVDPIDSMSTMPGTKTYGAGSQLTSASQSRPPGAEQTGPCGTKSSSHSPQSAVYSGVSLGTSVSVTTTTTTVFTDTGSRTGAGPSASTSTITRKDATDATTTVQSTRTSTIKTTVSPADSLNRVIIPQGVRRGQSFQFGSEEASEAMTARGLPADACEDASKTLTSTSKFCSGDYGTHICPNPGTQSSSTAVVTGPLYMTSSPTNAYQEYNSSLSQATGWQSVPVISRGTRATGKPVGLFRNLAGLVGVVRRWHSLL
ncbi:uncharacterized protein B0I36DRAFT_150160 [Microdochium trichocladiopsis]|uniref:Uncharacterized protein n=1 Tax=Microdochium trichocladiopsis TaxID=1682393 RepID=A0A9P8Y1J4_9PEZI|nr:uncharacterized protein B0I36DRAFT_150160 [Microdochium trichocladiopsis]KAH7025874.1 hypothetical protein B0I36DRAFT_150160 [Microdochium trichocladiopsis]